MSDDQNSVDTELFDSIETEGGAEADQGTAESSKETESSDQDLDLELDEQPKTAKKSVGELQKQKQLDVWTERVINGEVDLNRLPTNLLWMKKEIIARMETKSPSAVQDIDAKIEQKLAEKAENQRFEALKAELNEASLSVTQKIELQSEFKDLVASGLPKAKALEKALRIAGVDIAQQALDEQRKRMTIPTGRPMKVEREVNFLDKPEKDRLKMYVEQMNDPYNV